MTEPLIPPAAQYGALGILFWLRSMLTDALTQHDVADIPSLLETLQLVIEDPEIFDQKEVAELEEAIRLHNGN